MECKGPRLPWHVSCGLFRLRAGAVPAVVESSRRPPPLSIHLDPKGGIHVREDVAPSSFRQGTGSFEPTPGGYLADEESTHFMTRVGQAALIDTDPALVVLASTQRS